MEKWRAEKYARALVEVGVNIQPGETLLLMSGTEAADLAREITKCAFERGAEDVQIIWEDPETEHLRSLYASAETLKKVPDWKKEQIDSVLRTGTGVEIGVHGTFPSLNSDVSDENLLARAAAENELRNVVREYVHRAVIKWTGTAYPTVEWARKVYPEYEDDTSYAMLEEAVCSMMRVTEDTDPVENWRRHCADLAERSAKLNAYDFKSLHITSELGTDLTLDLVEGHVWLSAAEMGAANVNAPYVANMPTEEVFTDPDFRSVNGTVYASFPLYINGKLVRDFSITFKDGLAVDCSASEGEDFLRRQLFRDENTRRLGEVALVSKQSPIRKMGRIFYNGLIDENAACHLALGTSFPDCVKGGTEMTDEELHAIGVNKAVTHTDFMFGTDELKIVGTTHDGREITVMEHGDFVL